VGGRSSVLRLIEASSGAVKARIDLKASGIRQLAYDPASNSAFGGLDRGFVRLALRLAGTSVELVETGRALEGAPDRRPSG
jgi:hypothetical protein